MRVEVDAVWAGDRFRGRTVYEVDGPVLRRVDGPGSQARAATASGGVRLGGTLIPHLTDHHTHLGLTDRSALFRGGITDAVDLGWEPGVASTWLADTAGGPAVAIAGALLTAVGGYPVNAGWGPPGCSAELHGAADAVDAVRAQLAAGASRIKVTLNTVAGPTIDDDTLRAVVAEAHGSGVPVTVHVEGFGQAGRAIAAGADQLAHAPFTERLDDDLLQRAADAGMTWVSTLDVHGWGHPTAEFRVAQENIRRFAAAGGRILYGTDLGNGALPVGVDERELLALAEAGLDGTALLQSIAGADDPDGVGPRFAWLPDTPPTDPDRLPAWLAAARGRTVTDTVATLQEDS
jgi:imidazolonepropionase-like amidohydrolase